MDPYGSHIPDAQVPQAEPQVNVTPDASDARPKLERPRSGGKRQRAKSEEEHEAVSVLAGLAVWL